MRVVPIEALPNQELSINIDGNRWTLRIKVGRLCMFADVYLNDAPVLLGQRIAVGTPVIPYEYLATEGNFILIVDDEQLPDWQQFGISQFLLYASPGEISDDIDRDFSLAGPAIPGLAREYAYYSGEFFYDGTLVYDGLKPALEA